MINKIFIVVSLLILIFVIVQSAQAVEVDLSRDSDAASQALAEEETVDGSTTNTDKRRFLDGDTSNPDGGDTLVITDEGELIITSGNPVTMENGDNTVINNGKIEAEEIGIDSTGDDNKITNNGTITAKENGIDSTGNDNKITNNGWMITTGEFAYGINSRGTDNTITNSGWIETHGRAAYGISSIDDYAKITNFGTIETQGIASNGIYSYGVYDIINNYGSIITWGENASGIESAKSYATIINSGSISTKGEKADGIYAHEKYAKITNYGTLLTFGDSAYGIFSTNSESTITNSGSIITWGENASGINIRGKDNITTNYGTLLTFGDFAHGIYTTSDSGVVTNFGSIRVSGNGANGIWIESKEGVMSIINNYGLIYATGQDSYAIKTEEGNELLNLSTSSWILGRIDLGMGEDIVNIYSDNNPTIAKTLTFEGAESINYYGRVGVINGNRVATIDPTEHAVKATVLNSLTTGLHSVIHTRLNNIRPNTGRVWFDSFSSYRKRENEENLFAYDHAYKGGMGGVEKVYENLRIGVTAGFSRTNVEANSESFRTDSNSYLAGIYSLYDFGFLKLQASLFGGSEYHKSTRMIFDNLQGFENARADFKSYFLSPSIMVSKDYELTKRFILRPSVEAVYSAGWYEDYQEHGSTNSNIGIDRKTLSAMNCKAGLMATYRITDWCQVSVNGGGGARYTDDNSTDVDFEGSPFRIKSTNDDSVYSGYASANLNVDINQQLIMNFSVSHSEVSGDETNDFFVAGFKYSF